MHILVGVIVLAEDERSAIYSATCIMEELVSKNIYDYYIIIDSSTKPPKWEYYPTAMMVESDQGKKFIKNQLMFSFVYLGYLLNKIRSALEESNEKIYNEHSPSSEWLYHSRVSYMYDRFGNPIMTGMELNYVLAMVDDEDDRNSDFYVIPVDAHY